MPSFKGLWFVSLGDDALWLRITLIVFYLVANIAREAVSHRPVTHDVSGVAVRDCVSVEYVIVVADCIWYGLLIFVGVGVSCAIVSIVCVRIRKLR